MNAPAQVATQPRTACVEPYDAAAVEACVREVWRAGGYGEEEDFAVAVAWCESKFKPWEIGDNGNAFGLYQIWRRWHGWRRPPSWWDGGSWADPRENALLALEIRRASGWGPWSCAR